MSALATPHKALRNSVSALSVCLLASCSTVEELRPTPEAQALAAELRNGLAACTESQAESARLLEAQGVQLQQQQEAITAVTAALGELQEQVPAGAPSVEPAPVACDAVEPVATDKLRVGRRENVWLEDVQLSLPARIDTGAETASLDARNIELFERDGVRWVRFEILNPETGEPVELERKLERRARIIQAVSDEAERRPVIRLGVVIGTIRQYAEFTLSDRSHLDYQILIGRNVLNDVMIVDVSETNLAPPQLSADNPAP